jgi:ubiquitin-protein ligase
VNRALIVSVVLLLTSGCVDYFTDVFVSFARAVMLSGSIQDLLDSPNPDSPAQSEAFTLFTSNKEKYKARIREEARKHAPA